MVASSKITARFKISFHGHMEEGTHVYTYTYVHTLIRIHADIPHIPCKFVVLPSNGYESVCNTEPIKYDAN